MSQIPFVDLKAQWRSVRAEVDQALTEVLDQGSFIMGDALTQFEAEFATYCGAAHAVGVGSGLDALTLALQARGIGPGDEVVTVANTFIATACAVTRTGATPVLVDCVEGTQNIDPDRVAAAITPRTKAIIPVHLTGLLAEMDPVNALAQEHGLFVLEDAAQAHGAIRGGRRAGTLAHAGAFSFYPSKNLGAAGDGGIVVTDDPELAEQVRLLRSYGQRQKNLHEIVGGNSRLDSLQAAILRVKLRKLDGWNEGRRRAADLYRTRLADLPLVLPHLPAERAGHVYHLFSVRVAERDRVRSALGDAQIQSGIHYPIPIHLQPAYASLGYDEGSFPVAEKLAGEILSLPMFPELTADQIDRVGDALEEILS